MILGKTICRIQVSDVSKNMQKNRKNSYLHYSGLNESQRDSSHGAWMKYWILVAVSTGKCVKMKCSFLKISENSFLACCTDVCKFNVVSVPAWTKIKLKENKWILQREWFWIHTADKMTISKQIQLDKNQMFRWHLFCFFFFSGIIWLATYSKTHYVWNAHIHKLNIWPFIACLRADFPPIICVQKQKHTPKINDDQWTNEKERENRLYSMWNRRARAYVIRLIGQNKGIKREPKKK